jgi:hypothetical protein
MQSNTKELVERIAEAERDKSLRKVDDATTTDEKKEEKRVIYRNRRSMKPGPPANRKTFRERVRRYRQQNASVFCEECRKQVKKHTVDELATCIKKVFADAKKDAQANEVLKRWIRENADSTLTCLGCDFTLLTFASALQHVVTCDRCDDVIKDKKESVLVTL